MFSVPVKYSKEEVRSLEFRIQKKEGRFAATIVLDSDFWILSSVTKFWVTIARRTHPFPSRTRQLSSSAPMVLHAQVCGRVGSCPVYNKSPIQKVGLFLLCSIPSSVAALARGFSDPTSTFGRNPGNFGSPPNRTPSWCAPAEFDRYVLPGSVRRAYVRVRELSSSK